MRCSLSSESPNLQKEDCYGYKTFMLTKQTDNWLSAVKAHPNTNKANDLQKEQPNTEANNRWTYRITQTQKLMTTQCVSTHKLTFHAWLWWGRSPQPGIGRTNPGHSADPAPTFWRCRTSPSHSTGPAGWTLCSIVPGHTQSKSEMGQRQALCHSCHIVVSEHTQSKSEMGQRQGVCYSCHIVVSEHYQSKSEIRQTQGVCHSCHTVLKCWALSTELHT